MKKLLTFMALLLIASELTYSQDIIVKNDGSVINAYRTDYQGQFVYYQTEDSDSAPILRINKEDVLVIRLADGTAVTPNVAQPAQGNDPTAGEKAQTARNFPDIDLTDYHGFLLDKGNCVYVTYNSKVDYEVAAVEAIKQAIEENGLWKVVDKPSQAHFVLQFLVTLTGRDFARLLLRPRDNYEQFPFVSYANLSGNSYVKSYLCGGDYASDEVNVCVNVANAVMPPLLKDYAAALESPNFMESVKTGKLIKVKGSKEVWVLVNFVSVRYEVTSASIKVMHDVFYR